MVDRLAATRFLAVLGASGSGKSSLVRTGLLDALEIGLLPQAGSRWMIADFRPGDRPIHNLAKACSAPRRAEPRRPAGRGGGEAPARLPRARAALGRRMVRGGQPPARHEPAPPRRPVRGAVPLQRLTRSARRRRPSSRCCLKARGRRCRRRASTSPSPCAPNISGAAALIDGPGRGDQPRPLSHAAHEPRPGAQRDRRARPRSAALRSSRRWSIGF